MEISFVNKNKSIQPQQAQDMQNDPVRNISAEENKQYVIKNKVDSADISSSHTGSFDDKRILIAKSAILYDVSVNASPSSAGRIAELSRSIAEGTYDIPANLIADAILAN